MSVRVSIIVCTIARPDSLAATLESIGRLSIPPEYAVELLVVDNGSTDRTRSVIENFRTPHLLVRRIVEPIAGLSRARMAGINHAEGELMLFTDDDVRVPQDWIQRMSSPILAGNCDAVAGGVIFAPHLEALVAGTPLASLKGWFATTAGLNPVQPARMVGANMAIHRRVLEKVPGFDFELGPAELGFGEESLFSFQLKAAGYRLKGAFDITVEHHFDQARLTKESVSQLAYRMGRSQAFLAYHWKHIPSRMPLVKLAISRVRRWLAGLGTNGTISIRELWELQNVGFYREYLIQRRRPRKYSRTVPFLR